MHSAQFVHAVMLILFPSFGSGETSIAVGSFCQNASICEMSDFGTLLP